MEQMERIMFCYTCRKDIIFNIFHNFGVCDGVIFEEIRIICSECGDDLFPFWMIDHNLEVYNEAARKEIRNRQYKSLRKGKYKINVQK